MKNYQYHKRGFTLFEVSVALSIAIAALLSFVPYYIKIMERALVEQTAQRAKMVYEAAINYRFDNSQWPSDTAALKDADYLPAAATQTSWGTEIVLEPADNDNDLNMKFTLPEVRFVNAVAARLPAPQIDGMEIKELIVRPGEEASVQNLQDLAGTRRWTGHRDAHGKNIFNVNALSTKNIQTEFIVTTLDVTDETVCTREPLIGARAIKKGPDDSILPAFCDGETWKTPQQLELSDCKVCIACSDGSEWRLVTCDEADDDGWAISNKEVCANKGNLAIKFVCGPDSSAGRFPVAKYRDRRGNEHGVDDKLDWYPYEYYEDNP
ncbi:MAG: type II secretion system protein [Porticoccaceae bacterium]